MIQALYQALQISVSLGKCIWDPIYQGNSLGLEYPHLCSRFVSPTCRRSLVDTVGHRDLGSGFSPPTSTPRLFHELIDKARNRSRKDCLRYIVYKCGHSIVEQCVLCLPARDLSLWPETSCELLKKSSQPFELESQFWERSFSPAVAL